MSFLKSMKIVHFHLMVPVILLGHEKETDPVGSIERRTHIPSEKLIVDLLTPGFSPIPYTSISWLL